MVSKSGCYVIETILETSNAPCQYQRPLVLPSLPCPTQNEVFDGYNFYPYRGCYSDDGYLYCNCSNASVVLTTAAVD